MVQKQLRYWSKTNGKESGSRYGSIKSKLNFLQIFVEKNCLRGKN